MKKIINNKINMEDTVTINGVEYKRVSLGGSGNLETGKTIINVVKNKRWRAADGYKYFYINSSGYLDYNFEYNDSMDNFRYATHNYYETKELAQKALDKIEALARVNKYIEDNDLRIPDGELGWSNGLQDKYHILYNSFSKKLEISYCTVSNSGEIIGELKSREDAERLGEACKEDLELLLKK